MPEAHEYFNSKHLRNDLDSVLASDADNGVKFAEIALLFERLITTCEELKKQRVELLTGYDIMIRVPSEGKKFQDKMIKVAQVLAEDL